MRTAIRLCGGIAMVAFGFYAIITASAALGPSAATSPANCGAGYCDVTVTDLWALLFAIMGALFGTLTGLLVLIAGLRTRQTALGVGLALLIFTNLAVAIVYVVNDVFLEVLYYAPGAYFASNDQLPWYFEAATITFIIMLTLAPLPTLLFSPSRPGSRTGSSALPDKPGLRPQIPARLALTSVLLAGVSLVVLDRVVDHYAAAGVGPAWPLLASASGFYVLWLLAWLILMRSLLRRRPASVS